MSRLPALLLRAPDAARPEQGGFVSLRSGLILGSIALAVLLAMKFSPSWSSRTAAPGTPVSPVATPPAAGQPREVDFGFVELEPVRPTAIASFKKGGGMLLFAGDELHYEVLGDQPLPDIELRVGEVTQVLTGPAGSVMVQGPANSALKATLAAKGTRLSLPGGAPPRVSVKVQVYSSSRPA